MTGGHDVKGVGNGPRPWHVVLAPVVPVCGLLSANLVMIPPRAAAVSLLVLTSSAILFWRVVTLLYGDSRTAAVISTLLLLAAVSGTTIHRLITVLGPALGATIIVVLGLPLAVVLILRIGDRRGEITRFGNIALLLLSLLLVGQIARVELMRPRISAPSPLPALTTTRAAADLPDIYLLILDGYGRADVIRKLYAYENPIVNQLEELGFVVPTKATSNYAQTALSLGSLLNLDYVQALLADVRHEADDRRILDELIGKNRTFAALASAGYRIRSYFSEYPLIRPEPADERRGPWLTLTQFDYALYEETMFPWLFTTIGLPRGWEPARWHRRQINWTLDDLDRTSPFSDDRPTLVFAHVLMPHPPFVFTANGGTRATSLPISLNDGFEWRATAQRTSEDYESGYVDALKYVNSRVHDIVRHAIDREPQRRRPAVFQIQGDHGPGSRLHRDDVSATDLNERHGILLAARFPGAAETIYPSITPVNALRTLLNGTIGSRLEKLEDRSFFSTWEQPYRFIDVTDRIR